MDQTLWVLHRLGQARHQVRRFGPHGGLKRRHHHCWRQREHAIWRHRGKVAIVLGKLAQWRSLSAVELYEHPLVGVCHRPSLWNTYQATAAIDLPLFNQLTRSLTRLAANSEDGAMRARRMRDPPFFGVPVRTATEDWIILWSPADDDACPQIWYIGHDPTA